jgi:hypothetical protein
MTEVLKEPRIARFFWVVGFGDVLRGEKGEPIKGVSFSPNLSTQSFLHHFL